jgi:hypothetical protein
MIRLLSSLLFSRRLAEPVEEGRWSERTPVHVGVPVASHGIQVLSCCIPFVSVETVPRITRVELLHQTITRDLGDDRCRRDCRAPAVAVDDGALRHQEVRDVKGVDEDEVR